jgi:fermentation-respiration switch protein FrsA (DUF1100 family)
MEGHKKRWEIYSGVARILLILQICFAFPLLAAVEPAIHNSIKKIPLHGKTLDLHLAIPEKIKPGGYYVLYASGDGGWFGTTVKMFKEFSLLGFPVAGFSSKSYLKLLGNSPSPVNLEELVQDYFQIAQACDGEFRATSHGQIILAGWSRGAAFSMLVGSDPDFKPRCGGVIGFGLPDKEELKIHRHGKRVVIADVRPHPQIIFFDTYDRIPEISPLPVALIQSTRDDFLPADSAHLLFGNESPLKKFFAVAAENHRFSGGWPEFQKCLGKSLEWIAASKPDLQAAPEKR